jgi:hypothetical protein
MEMRKALLVAVICLTASVVFAQGKLQPLNVKTGLWQVTGSTTMNGAPPIPAELQARMAKMTPEQRAQAEAMIKSRFGGAPLPIDYKKCLTAKDLNTDPFSKPDQKCTWTVQRSTSSEMDVQGSNCTAGKNEGITLDDIEMKIRAIDSENTKISVHLSLSGNGQTMTSDGTFTSKWLGASCPAGT